jgi:hypothetical protein
VASTSENAPAVGHDAAVRLGSPAPPRSGRVDGRFGRCGGCVRVLVFCGVCASVRARCRPCAAERRRAGHREANRVYGRSPGGQASGRRRQARFRAGRGARVTDAISTQGSPPPMPSSPSSSVEEATRIEEIPTDESSEPKLPRHIAVVRCAGCGRALSGRVRPSERSPARRRGPRVPRLSRAP